MNETQNIIKLLSICRYSLHNEKAFQQDIADALKKYNIPFLREHILDKSSKPDFTLNDGIIIEAKIKGNAKKIYKQCVRYCEFESVKTLILITNRTIGFPKEIKGKSCYVINTGKAWL